MIEITIAKLEWIVFTFHAIWDSLRIFANDEDIDDVDEFRFNFEVQMNLSLFLLVLYHFSGREIYNAHFSHSILSIH